RPRREVDAVFAWLDGLRGQAEERELAGGGLQLLVEHPRIPLEAGVAGFHGLVAAPIQAPVEVEAVDLVPVALPEGARKAATGSACGVNADKIGAVRAGDNLVDHRFRGRECPAAHVLARLW